MKVRRLKIRRDAEIRRQWVTEWLARRLADSGRVVPEILNILRMARDAGYTAKIKIKPKEAKVDG